MAEFHPPEGLLREIALKMCSAEPGTSTEVAGTKVVHGFHGSDKPCQWCLFDAERALAALFEACTVRERWYVKHLNAKGRSNWTRIFNHYAEAVDVEARNRAAAEREGDRSVLLRTVALNWTDPPPPVSSTGEEPVPDPPVREETSSG